MPCAEARITSLLRAACAIGLILSRLPSVRAETPKLPNQSVSEERVELFLAQLKRRALQALEAHREQLAAAAKPAPVAAPARYSVSVDLTQGYESNVLLDGFKRGDIFLQEAASLSLLPQVTSWLSAEFSYDMLNTHYSDLRDANLWMNTLGGILKIKPHPRLRTELKYEYALVNFPFDTGNSFNDHRVGSKLFLKLASWLTLAGGWTHQWRAYDTRKAREGSGDDRLDGAIRQDQRNTVSQELIFKMGRTYAKLAGQIYHNDSNDAFQDAYDWQDGQVQVLLSRVFGLKWIASTYAGVERRNYEERTVSPIHFSERDTLTTIAGSLIYLMSERLQLTYTLTYRYQDSNDPLLDFVDWINQWRVSFTY